MTPSEWVAASFVAATTVTVGIGIAQLSKHPNLGAFPTFGTSGGWLGSWWAGIKYFTNGVDIVRRGYQKFNGAPFKIATLFHWIVVINSRAHIEELLNAREDEISFLECLNEELLTKFTMGPEIHQDPFHVTVIRSRISRTLWNLYPELREEIFTAFDDILGLDDNEWKSVPARSTVQQIVCRASNRLFVGLPLCRDPEYIALNIQYTVDVITSGHVIRFFPNILRPLAARFLTNTPTNIRRGISHFRPIIEERQKDLNEYGKDWTEKPNDLLSWFMDDVPDATVESLAIHMLASNFTAIHTTANLFTQALYNLAANPQYIEPLREEVEAIIKEEGWTRTSVIKMHKVDSFLKESIRMEGMNAMVVRRKAVKDFTFSDGTLIPKGTRMGVNIIGLHFDDTIYANPDVFDPFRFAGKGNEDGEWMAHRQFAATSLEYLPFGHGHHACAGRFFAAAELKTMLGYMVMTYDVKLEPNTARPPTLHIGSSIVANRTAKVMFRKRAQHNAER